MTRVKFYIKDDIIIGFRIVGHSSTNCNDVEGKIVCAAVSSAAYMAVNTITDIVGAKVNLTVNDAQMKMLLLSKNQEAQIILKGLKLHLTELGNSYQKNIEIVSEV